MNLLRIYSYTLLGSARVCSRLLSFFHAHLKWAWALVRGLLLWMLSLHCISLRYKVLCNCYKVLQSVTTCCPTRCNVLRFTLCSSNFFAFTRVLLRERRTICARWLLCSTTWVSCLVLQMPLQMRSSWCDEKCHFCILLWVCLYCIVLLHVKKCHAFSNAPARTVSKLFSEQTKNCSRFSTQFARSCVHTCVQCCGVGLTQLLQSFLSPPQCRHKLLPSRNLQSLTREHLRHC